MAAERIQAVARRYREYLQRRAEQGERRTRTMTAPLEMLFFDRVELTGSPKGNGNDYQWLAAYIEGLSDEEVDRKMKQLRDSFPTIDEAFLAKLQMELM